LFAAAGTGDDQPGPPGREVVLVAALSADDAGDRLRELLARAGVRLVELPLDGPTPDPPAAAGTPAVRSPGRQLRRR